LEESQVFVPQKPQKGEERMLGAFEDIIRIGRNFGIGATLISQRPQSINKEVLNQTECLIVGRLIGAHERKAMVDWIRAKDVDIEDLVDSLPKMDARYKWIWSPSWLEIFQEVRINKTQTFDSSATPKAGEKRKQKKLRPVDLEQLTDEMARVIQEAQDSDPKALQAKIRQLEAELKRERQKPPETKFVETEVREVPPEVVQGLKETREKLQELEKACEKSKTTWQMAKKPPAREPLTETPKSVRAKPSNGSGPRVVGKMQDILNLLYWFPDNGLKREEIALAIGMAPTGGGFTSYLSKLNAPGLIEKQRNGRITLTYAGRERVSNPPAPPGPEDTLDLWRSKKAGRMKDILQVLFDHYPNEMSREALAERVGMEPSGGGFTSYLSKLRAPGLIEGSSELRLSNSFFL
jgi:hypothetical protein